MNFKLMYTPFYDSWCVLMYEGKRWMISHGPIFDKEEAVLTVIQLNRTVDNVRTG